MSNEELGVEQTTGRLARQRSFPSEIVPAPGAAMEELNRAWALQFRQRHAAVIASEGLDAIVEFDRKVEAAILARPRIQQAALLLESTLMQNSAVILNNYMNGYR